MQTYGGRGRRSARVIAGQKPTCIGGRGTKWPTHTGAHGRRDRRRHGAVAGRARRSRDPGRAAGGLGRRRHLRAQPRRPRRGERRRRTLYTLVYDAERPELFLKDAGCRRTVGPGEPIGVRGDSSLGRARARDRRRPRRGRLARRADDRKRRLLARRSRATNPLYLPQAKIFAGACALGPAVLVPDDWEAPLEIRMRILDADGAELFAGETSTARMRRSFAELVEWLAARQPGPGRERPAHRHRPRPAGRLHARARPRGRDPRSRVSAH